MIIKLFKLLCVIFFLSFSQGISAQDERFTRKLLSGELVPKEAVKLEGNYKYKARSPYYEVDLNNDDRNESFAVEKKDSEDWFHVYNYEKKKIYSLKMEAIGTQSRLYRISSRKISSQTTVYILHFFEGGVNSLTFKGQARFYFLTIDNRDLSTLATYKGPAFWDEYKSFRFNHYHQRKYDLTAVDFNKDGIKELSLSYNNIKRVFIYKGKGNWSKF